MQATTRIATLLVFALSSCCVAADDQLHRITDLKITILSTMLAQNGVGEWGFSALVEADGHRVLFDTGLRPDTVLLNAESLGIDLSDVEKVVLSHNHGDHTGGLVRLRRELRAENERAMRIAHVAPPIFWERPGSNSAWAIASKKEAFEEEGGTFVMHEEATQIYPGIWLTGPVPRLHPEKNYGFWADGKHEVGVVNSPDGPTDDNVPESMSMVINTGKGLVAITGCGHAGLINTLEHAANVTGVANVHAAIGGFHLLQASDEVLTWTANKLVDLGTENLIGAHCTGLEPIYRFRELTNLDRSTAVVGSTGAYFTLEDGIEALSLAH